MQVTHYQQQQNYCIIITSGTKVNMPFTTPLKIQSLEVKDKNIFLCLSTRNCKSTQETERFLTQILNRKEMSKIIRGRGLFLIAKCYQNSHEIPPALVRAISKLLSGWVSPLPPRPTGILWPKLLYLQPLKAAACKLHTGNDPWHAATSKSWPRAAFET